MVSEPLLRSAGALLAACAAALVATPLARRAALAKGVLSYPTQRGVHSEPIPYLGGLGILVGLLAGTAFLPAFAPHVLGLAAGALVIALVGAYDDAKGMRWVVKLGLQLAIALGVWFCGVRIEEWSPPFTEEYVDLGWTSAALTALWLVAVMNAINFIDGLDGLAGGVSAIAGMALVGIAAWWIAVKGASAERVEVLVLAAALVGSCLGFLRYNFHPARIFMGDSGALSLGLWLASLSVLGAFKSTLLYLCPIVLLGLPLSDTAWAALRRLWRRQSPATADREHIHHRVLGKVEHQRTAVLILYAVSLGLAAIATWLGRP